MVNNKKKINPMLIIGGIIMAFFILNQGGVFQGAVTQDATVNREIIFSGLPGDTVTVNLNFIGGTEKFGGIVQEQIPNGFTVNGISAQNLGIGGSASGKLTGQLFEIAFAADNIGNPSVTYTLTSPTGTIPQVMPVLTGTFEYAEGGPSGTTEGDTEINLCLPVCTRPSNLCTEAVSVSDGCGGNCDGEWTVTQNSVADEDCTNSVSNDELLSAISKWVANTSPFDDNQVLLDVITAWVGS